MTRASSQRGFTLVEVMIALLIFGMIAAAGVALLSFSVRAQGMTAAKSDATTALLRLTSAMEADFAQAVPRRARDADGRATPAFLGEAGAEGASILLVREGWTNIDGAPRPGLQKVLYRLNGDVLERVAFPQVDGAQPLPALAMLDGVQGVAARYRYRGAWSDTWQGTPQAALPDAIELRIQRARGPEYRALFIVGTRQRPRPGEGMPNAP